MSLVTSTKDVTRTTIYTLEDNLGYLLNRCASAMAARFEQELAVHNVTLAQWCTMLALSAGRASTPSELADAVGTDKGATSRLIARMVEKGLVVRTHNRDDGRSVKLALSDGAKALMPILSAKSKAVNADTLGLLDKTDQQELMRILSLLLSHMVPSDTA